MWRMIYIYTLIYICICMPDTLYMCIIYMHYYVYMHYIYAFLYICIIYICIYITCMHLSISAPYIFIITYLYIPRSHYYFKIKRLIMLHLLHTPKKRLTALICRNWWIGVMKRFLFFLFAFNWMYYQVQWMLLNFTWICSACNN